MNLQTRFIVNVGNLMLISLCPKDVTKMGVPNKFLKDAFLAEYKRDSPNYFEKVESWLSVSQDCKPNSNNKYAIQFSWIHTTC